MVGRLGIPMLRVELVGGDEVVDLALHVVERQGKDQRTSEVRVLANDLGEAHIASIIVNKASRVTLYMIWGVIS